jgi:hypothetical protein
VLLLSVTRLAAGAVSRTIAGTVPEVLPPGNTLRMEVLDWQQLDPGVNC